MLGHNFLWFYWFNNERYGLMWDRMESFHKLPQLFKNNDLLYFIWLNFKMNLENVKKIIYKALKIVYN